MGFFKRLHGKPKHDGQVYCPRCRRPLPQLEYERNRPGRVPEGAMEGLSQVLGQTNTSCPYCGETINIAKLWKGQYDG